MSHAAPWVWETHRGDAGELHGSTAPTAALRTVREQLVTSPAIVLGSSQSEHDLDPAAVSAAAVDVVRRRSGGGAVLLTPGAHVWLDVWLPRTDPSWVDDVGRAGDWLADVWVAAAAALGVPDPRPHRGPLETGPWSAQVCFTGLGPGEVTSGSRKLVGVSQRRTRDWARFQCLVHRRWDAAGTFALLSTPGATAAGEEWRDRVADVGDAGVVPAFRTALDRLA